MKKEAIEALDRAFSGIEKHAAETQRLVQLTEQAMQKLAFGDETIKAGARGAASGIAAAGRAIRRNKGKAGAGLAAIAALGLGGRHLANGYAADMKTIADAGTEANPEYLKQQRAAQAATGMSADARERLMNAGIGALGGGALGGLANYLSTGDILPGALGGAAVGGAAGGFSPELQKLLG